jgi:antitoxin (DNA-binding transcriptional repressor) of toxin-antitoxin stability system
MIRLNISEVKTHLSKYLTKLRNGYTILLCKRNVPIAEIRPIKSENRGPRPIGLDKGRFVVPKNFNDPLPDWLLDLFEGKEPK